MLPIIDFHCDFLGCLESNQKLNFDSPEINCSVPQLIEGNVFIQTLALFSVDTSKSAKKALKQLELYKTLLREKSDQIASIREFDNRRKKVHTVLAIENASCLVTANEPLEKAFERLEAILEVEKVSYISLTWNNENRFGGGNLTSVGLKNDGVELLKYLSGKGIAIDFSHTSDALAHDLLNTMDQFSLDLCPIASHSNFRSVKNVARNLPDEFAKEIFTRNGVIGVNFIRDFIGDTKEDFVKHFKYGIELGGENQLCFGSDFFGGLDVHIPTVTLPIFQKELSNASHYPAFIRYLISELGEETAEKITAQNAYRWMVENSMIQDHVLETFSKD